MCTFPGHADLQCQVVRTAASAMAASTWLEMCRRVSQGAVLIRQIVRCARIVGECAANKAMSTHGSALATLLGHGHALEMATWGKHKQCTCEVKHVAAVLEWAVDVEDYCGINVLGQEQR